MSTPVPNPYTQVRNYLYVSKYPDRPLQIRDIIAVAVPAAVIGRQSIPANAPGAVVHRMQLSSVTQPLSSLLPAFDAAAKQLAVKIGRPVVVETIPEGLIAKYDVSGKPGDRILIELVFKVDRGLIELLYKSLPPIVVTQSGTVTV